MSIPVIHLDRTSSPPDWFVILNDDDRHIPYRYLLTDGRVMTSQQLRDSGLLCTSPSDLVSWRFLTKASAERALAEFLRLGEPAAWYSNVVESM